MNSDTLQGQWKQLKGKAKEKWGCWPKTTSTRSRGSGTSSTASSKKRYGYARDVAEQEVDAFSTRPPRV